MVLGLRPCEYRVLITWQLMFAEGKPMVGGIGVLFLAGKSRWSSTRETHLFALKEHLRLGVSPTCPLEPERGQVAAGRPGLLLQRGPRPRSGQALGLGVGGGGWGVGGGRRFEVSIYRGNRGRS